METRGSTHPAPGKRRIRKRIVIPYVLLVLVIVIVVGLWIRGSWADTVEKNPASAADGARTHLYRNPDGHTYVRSAIVVDAPPRDVWAVLIDHPNHAKTLPFVSALSGTHLGEGQYKVAGTAHSYIWGDWAFTMTVHHEETPAKGEYTSWWDEPSADLAVNRARWTVKPAGDGKTLLAFALEIEVRHYPNPLIRNILLDRVYAVLKALRDEVMRRSK